MVALRIEGPAFDDFGLDGDGEGLDLFGGVMDLFILGVAGNEVEGQKSMAITQTVQTSLFS